MDYIFLEPKSPVLPFRISFWKELGSLGGYPSGSNFTTSWYDSSKKNFQTFQTKKTRWKRGTWWNQPTHPKISWEKSSGFGEEDEERTGRRREGKVFVEKIRMEGFDFWVHQ